RQGGADRLRHLERIGGRLLDHAHRHRALAVEAGDDAVVLGAELGMADILEAHDVAVDVAQHEIVELLRRLEVGLAQHGELAAPASTLAISDSSASRGSVLRTRPTRSRTSLAAASTLRVSAKWMVIWLVSARLTEVMNSMPSMPDSESSSGLVICDSMISALAP